MLLKQMENLPYFQETGAATIFYFLIIHSKQWLTKWCFPKAFQQSLAEKEELGKPVVLDITVGPAASLTRFQVTTTFSDFRL